MARTIPTKDSIIQKMLRLNSDLRPSSSVTGPTTMLEQALVGIDGNTYAIIREGHRYFIKVAPGSKGSNPKLEDYDYINGFANRLQESSENRDQLLRRLEGRLALLREEHRDRYRPGTDIRNLVEHLERLHENRGVMMHGAAPDDENAKQQDALLSQLAAVPETPPTPPPAPAPEPSMAAAPPMEPEMGATPSSNGGGSEVPPPAPDMGGDPAGMPPADNMGQPETTVPDPMGGDPQTPGGDGLGDEEPVDPNAPPADPNAPVDGNSSTGGGGGGIDADGEGSNNEVQSLLGELGQLVSQMREVPPTMAKSIVNSAITMAAPGLKEMPDTELEELSRRITRRGEKLDEESIAPQPIGDFVSFAEESGLDLQNSDDVSRAITLWAENWNGKTEDADIDGIRPYLTPEVKEQIGSILPPSFLALLDAPQEEPIDTLNESIEMEIQRLIEEVVRQTLR